MARGNERGTSGGRGQDTRGRTASGSAGQRGAEKRSADSARTAASTSTGRTSTGRSAGATGGSSGSRGSSSVGRGASTTGGATGTSAGGTAGGVSGVTSGASTVGSVGRRSGGVGGGSAGSESDATRGSQASTGSVDQGLTGAVSGVDAPSGAVSGGRTDQERQLSVSRESGQREGSQVPTGQGRTGRTTGEGGLARRQMPSLFDAPPELLAGAMLANPFGFMRRMSEEMNRAFEDFGFGVPGRSRYERSAEGTGGQGLMRRPSRGVWAPQMEVFQRGNEVVIRAELPGLSADEVNVEIDDGVLTISGERRDESDDREEGYYRSERSYGSFFRSIAIPEGVNEDDVTAAFRDGVLELRIPLPEQQQRAPRKVPIKS